MPESAKECASPLAESSDIGLGAGDRAFEPRYSDQKPLEIHDLKGLLLFYIERSWNEIVSVFLLVCYKYPQKVGQGFSFFTALSEHAPTRPL